MVARALGGDGQAIQLTRQADREVADVDHFLHFALAFLGDLAGFDRYQLAELGLVFTQYFAEQADQLTAARGRDVAPGLESFFGLIDLGSHLGFAFQVHRGNRAAIDRGVNGMVAVGVGSGRDTEAVKQSINHFLLLHAMSG